MKLHAIEDRRAGGAIDKRAGDAWDMYRILLDLDGGGAVRDELTALPEAFRHAVRSASERIFVQHAARTISWLKSGDDRMAVITADELTAVGRPLVEALPKAT